jgi:precorrin-6A/cobalt-precorrin-6A reductase
MRRILILGGTVEARRLAERLAPRRDLAVTVSLAGRTAAPARQPVPVRSGGFGGVEGLVRYLTAERIDAVIDATHPYAAQIADHAARACERTGTRLLALRRPPWVARDGDRWTTVAGVGDAVRVLGVQPRRVLLALGRKEIAPFAGAPQHFYLVRSVDPVEPPLAVPRAVYITARGPFAEAEELHLLRTHGIDRVVCKNSGGEASYAKIAAARALKVPVIMVARPRLPDVATVDTIEAAVAWLDHGLASGATLRGV